MFHYYISNFEKYILFILLFNYYFYKRAYIKLIKYLNVTNLLKLAIALCKQFKS